MRSKIAVLDYRQDRLEKDLSKSQDEVLKIKLKLEVVSFKVQELTNDQLKFIRYVSLEVGHMLVREAGMCIRFKKVFRQVEGIKRSNAFILNTTLFSTTRRIPRNPSRRMFCDAPRNAIVPSSINERRNPADSPNSENRLNGVDAQSTSFMKNFFYSIRDFIYSSAEVAVFFLSLGFFRRSFTLEESNSCVEKLGKVGRNFSKLARFISIEFRQNIHAFTIHNELHVNINNTSNINRPQ